MSAMLFSSGFWGRTSHSENIEKLVKDENSTIEDFLDDDDFVHELKTGNENLRKWLK